MSQDGAHDAPRGPKTAPDSSKWPKSSPRRPRRGQQHSKTLGKSMCLALSPRPQDCSKIAREGSKSAPKAPKSASRWPQEAPRRPEEAPGGPNSRPRGLQETPKRPQEGLRGI
eukprot:8123144-Pyramimonas_sp.AAC.1